MSYRIRFTLPGGRTGHFMRDYGTREDAQRAIEQAIDDRKANTVLAYTVEEVVTPEARIRELEAELAQLRDAYDAARQDLSVAKRKVDEVKTTAAMLESDLFTARASHSAASAIAAEAHCKTVASMVRLDRALAIGDAMHRAHPSEEWAVYKDSLATSRQGPAKASGEAGGTAHTGPGHQPGAGHGVASRLIVDLGAIEREGPAKASEAPGEGGDSGEGAK